MVRVRQAHAADAAGIAASLRETDLREIQAALSESPLDVVTRAIARSQPCYAVVDERDQALAVFGAIPVPSEKGVGVAWLLASTGLARYRFSFLRHSLEWIERLHESYGVLWNCVDARNQVHIRWLKWCGFSVLSRIEEYGTEKRPFYEFQRVRRG